MEHSSLLPFDWVFKRDGRLVPFEADKINRALFAASEALGEPSALLARELTDSILYFLASEVGNHTPTTAQIEELVIKIVRELGHPRLAQAYAQFPRIKDKDSAPQETSVGRLVAGMAPSPSLAWELGRKVLGEFALSSVFTRDIVAAHDDGLLTLTGLQGPFELAACVLGSDEGSLLESIFSVRQIASEFIAVDSPEHSCNAADSLVRELSLGLRATHLSAIVNLNCATPPSWAGELAEGPLFSEHRQHADSSLVTDASDRILEGLLAVKEARLHWHVAERDFADLRRLNCIVRHALNGADITFVFDRPRLPVSLGEGLSRREPAIEMVVGLGLPKLLEHVASGNVQTTFLRKLGSLARLALSAAVQKRDFLRRQHPQSSALARGFLLNRARLMIVPIGLEEIVGKMFGCGLCSVGPALEFAREVLHQLQRVLTADGRSCFLETCLDSPPAEVSLPPGAGIATWDSSAAPQQQLRAASVLHAIAPATAYLLHQGFSLTSPENITELLQYTWKQTDIYRLRLLRLASPAKQSTAF
jgi:hypothetical protein